jgi:adenylate kinase family enzyme
MELRIQQCDTVIFLDYSVDVCLAGIRQRQGKPRGDIPWLDTEEDEEFIDFIRNYNTQSRPQVIELLSQYPNKRIHIFTNRREADLFLTQLKPSS